MHLIKTKINNRKHLFQVLLITVILISSYSSNYAVDISSLKWSVTSPFTDSNLNSIAFTGDTTVIAANDDNQNIKLYYSNDCVEWKDISSFIASKNLKSFSPKILSNEKQFLVYGLESPEIIASQFYGKWEIVSCGLTVEQATVYNQKFYISGKNSSGRYVFKTSDDAVNWSDEIPLNIPDNIHTSMLKGFQIFDNSIICAFSDLENGCTIYYTIDRLSWSEIFKSNRYHINGIKYINGMYYAFGSVKLTTYGALGKSTNLQDWNFTEFGQNSIIQDIAQNDSEIICLVRGNLQSSTEQFGIVNSNNSSEWELVFSTFGKRINSLISFKNNILILGKEGYIFQGNPEISDCGLKKNTPSQWAQNEILEAKQRGILPDKIKVSVLQLSTTREEFCELAVKLYERLKGKKTVSNPFPFQDTDNLAIAKAYELGIVKGVGNNLFDPYRQTNRQEISVMLVRALRAINPDLANKPFDNNVTFYDEKDIASWAKQDIKFLYYNGIIKGIAEKTIAPLNWCTREQSAALANRLYSKFFSE